MKRSPYSPYHGRKSVAHKLLTAIVVLLAILLILALAALFVLPGCVVYTADGPRLDLPFFSDGEPSPAPTVPAAPSEAPTDQPDVVVVESPSASPSPSAAPRPDLSDLPRRDLPLGLVPAAGEGPGKDDGSLFDQRVPGRTSDQTRRNSVERNRSLLYAAAYIDPDWDSILPQDDSARTTGFSDYITAWCLNAAADGYDEIILAESVRADGDADGQVLADLFRRLKKELDDAGWQGRLGLVLDQELFGAGYTDDLIPAVAQSFERLYFRSTLTTANKNALTDGGFTATGHTLVTVVQNKASLNYAWAILPR